MDYFCCIPQDCLLRILHYLGLGDLLRTLELSHTFYDLLTSDEVNNFWLNYVLQHFATGNRCELKIRACSSSLLLARHILHALKVQPDDLIQTVVAVSSVDRWPESPLNVIGPPSACWDTLQKIGPRMRSAGMDMNNVDLMNLIILQYSRCSCFNEHNKSCYWSSGPIRSIDGVEYMTFKLKSSLSIVSGFSVLPYCALFQPNAPVYSPKQVAIQILLPNTSRAYPPFPSTTHRVTHYRNDVDLGLPDTPNTATTSTAIPMMSTPSSSSARLDPCSPSPSLRYRKRMMKRGMDDIWYQSAFYDIPPNESKILSFFLPAPLLVTQSMMIRIIFKGCHQRQEVLPAIAMEVPVNDYYICINQVTIFGQGLAEFDFQGCITEEEAAPQGSQEESKSTRENEQESSGNSSSQKEQRKIRTWSEGSTGSVCEVASTTSALSTTGQDKNMTCGEWVLNETNLPLPMLQRLLRRTTTQQQQPPAHKALFTRLMDRWGEEVMSPHDEESNQTVPQSQSNEEDIGDDAMNDGYDEYELESNENDDEEEDEEEVEEDDDDDDSEDSAFTAHALGIVNPDHRNARHGTRRIQTCPVMKHNIDYIVSPTDMQSSNQSHL